MQQPTRPGLLWRLAHLGMAFGSALSLAGTRLDVISLFCHFQVYALVAWTAGVAVFALRPRVRAAFTRPRLALAVGLACWSAHAALIAGLWRFASAPAPDPAPPPEHEAALDVVSFNMHHDEAALAQLEERLLADPPDVLVLIETNRRTEPQRLTGYLHRLRSEPSELGIWSRLPLVAGRAHAVHRDRDVLEATFAAGDRRLTLLAAHWRVPIRLSHFTAARTTVELAARHDDLLLIGDLNSTPWSPQLRALREESGLRPTWRGLQTTWARDPWHVLTLPIDHALVKGGVRVLEAGRLPWTASDHRPLRVRVAF